MKTGLVFLVSLLLSVNAALAGCPADKVVVTKPGYFGAINPDVYSKMDHALRTENHEELAALIAEKTVAEIPASVKACVIDEAFNWYRKQIELPGLQVPYWVPDGAVSEVR